MLLHRAPDFSIRKLQDLQQKKETPVGQTSYSSMGGVALLME